MRVEKIVNAMLVDDLLNASRVMLSLAAAAMGMDRLTVCGKINRANSSGAIDKIERLRRTLSKCLLLLYTGPLLTQNDWFPVAATNFYECLD